MNLDGEISQQALPSTESQIPAPGDFSDVTRVMQQMQIPQAGQIHIAEKIGKLKEYMEAFFQAKFPPTRDGSEQHVIDNEDAKEFIEGLQKLRK